MNLDSEFLLKKQSNNINLKKNPEQSISYMLGI